MLAIDPQLLAGVVGGRKTPGPQDVNPQVYQSMAQIAQAVKGAGEQIAQAKVAANQQTMQFMGDVMKQKMGRG